MNPLTVKILGSGNAAKKHAQAFAELPELYQITDSDTADIIDICTPNWMHYDQISAYLAAAHIIVEKPICGSLDDCDRIAVIQSRGTQHVFPISQYRFADHAGVDIDTITRWQRDASYYDGWRGDWEQALGGCLITHGIHTLDLVLRKYGMPLTVSADMNTWLGPETFAGLLIGEPGAMLRITTMIHPEIPQGGFRLGDSHAGYVNQFTYIHDAITKDAPPPVTLIEARNVLEVITAAYWSAYTGETAMLPITPEHPFYRGWSRHFALREHNNRSSLQTPE